MTAIHNWTLFITWISIGVALYLVCLIGSIKAKTARVAINFAMPAIVVALYAMMPLMAVFHLREDHFAQDMLVVMLALALPTAVVAIIPTLIAGRKGNAERRRAKQAREDNAEWWLRKYGA